MGMSSIVWGHMPRDCDFRRMKLFVGQLVGEICLKNGVDEQESREQ